MEGIRLAIKILKTLIKDQMQYPDRLLVDTFSVVARCGILLILYWHVFRLNNGIINGNTFLYTSWSIFFYFSFSVLGLRNISREIMRDIQTGNVEVLFSKPISYLSYRMWWQVGSGLYSFIVITLLATIVLFLIVGIPSTMVLGIFLPTFVLTFLCGAVLSLFLYAIVGLLSFWIEDVNPVYWIVDKAVMILGGSYLPIALFPEFMLKIALWSPFGASLFVTHTVYESWQKNWYQMVGVQLLWIISLGLVVHFMFEIAKRKVSVNGG